MLLLASTAFAQGAKSLSEISQKQPVLNTVVGKIMGSIIVPIIEGLFVFTFCVFVWGVVKMIRNGDDPDERKIGQNHILWSTIGMALMISAYGIVRLIGSTVGGIGV